MDAFRPSFALDASFTTKTMPFDGRHRAMKFGFSQSDVSGNWVPVEGDRRLNQFELVQAGSGSLFYLRLLTNDRVDDDQPAAVVFSSRPAIETVAAGTPNPESPFTGQGPNIGLDRSRLPQVQLDQYSAGLNDERFAYSWLVGPVDMLQVGPGEEARFELLVEARVMVGGEIYDFKVDPELVIQGGG